MTTTPAPSAPLTPEEVEKIIDDMHEMVNMYGGEGDFDRWCNLRAFIRKLQVEKSKPSKFVDLNECGNFFDALIHTFRSLQHERDQLAAQLKTRTEDAENLYRAVIDLILNGSFSANGSQGKAYRRANSIIDGLHHSYPPKP